MQLILYIKVLLGRPWDGHTLASILPDIECLTGVPLWRISVDRGYKGYNTSAEYEPKVIVTGQRGNTTPAIRKNMRWRNAIEPVIGHGKNEHRMGRNFLSSLEDNVMNAMLVTA